jgi:hypothetical protein
VSGLMMARTGRPPVILVYQPPPFKMELRDTAWSWPVPVRPAWYSAVQYDFQYGSVAVQVLRLVTRLSSVFCNPIITTIIVRCCEQSRRCS